MPWPMTLLSLHKIKQPTNTFTMALPSLILQLTGPGKSAIPTPGSLCGRGWTRAVWWVLFNNVYRPRKNSLLTKQIYFSYLPPLNFLCPPKRWCHPPCTLPSGYTCSSIPAWLSPHVFSWLLCAPPLIGGHLSSDIYIYIYIFSCLYSTP